MKAELKALNEAAYAAAKAASRVQSPLADELRRIAQRTDDLVDEVAE